MQGPYAHNILAYLTYFNIWEYHSCFSPHFRWLFFFGAGWILWSPPLGPTSTTMRPFSPSTGRVGTTPGLATWIRWARWERWEDPFFWALLSVRFFSSDLQHPTTSTTIQSQTLSHVDSSHIAPVRFGQSKPQLLFHPWDACILRLHPWSFIYLPRWRRCLENCVLLLTQMFGFKRLMVVGKQEPHNSKRQATCLLQISLDFSFPSPALVEETKAALTCSCPPYPSGHGSSRFMTQLHIHRLSGHWVIFGIQHLFIFWVGSLFIG